MTDAVHICDSIIYGNSWAEPELRALFSEPSRIHGWLEVMSMLAEVQAEFGLIPKQAATEIDTSFKQLEIDSAFLQEAAEDYHHSNHSLLGIINAFKKRCGQTGGEWFCYGVTVQDITDTHTMRVLKIVRQRFIEQLTAIEKVLEVMAVDHQHTLMCGRTHGQPGLPITFGFKAACWLDELDRHRLRLLQLANHLDVGQLAGGVGSLSSLGDQALKLQSECLTRLGLNSPAISWTSSRDRFAEWLQVLAMITATGDRIGQEIFNLQRPEIGELCEGGNETAVGSITMPQKQNPEISEHLGTLSRLVRHHAAHMTENLVHSHERDGRAWKSEWAIIPEASLATGKALTLLTQLLSNLQVNSQRMMDNIEQTQGFICAEKVMLALAQKLGKQSAHSQIYRLSRIARLRDLHLKQAALQDKEISHYLSRSEIDALFELEQSAGCCAQMVEQVLARIHLP